MTPAKTNAERQAAFRARQAEQPEVRFRCTKAQREKLDRLGGAQWIRDRIDRAKEVK